MNAVQSSDKLSWGGDLPIVDAIAFLNNNIQPPHWNIGHFLWLAGTATGTEKNIGVAE